MQYKLIQAQHQQMQTTHENKMRRYQNEIDRNNMLLNGKGDKSKMMGMEIRIQTKKSSFNESEYKSWTSEIVVLWIESIENGLFKRNQSIELFKKNLTENSICGNHLRELNDLALKILGINDDHHRKLILSNIDRLISKKN